MNERNEVIEGIADAAAAVLDPNVSGLEASARAFRALAGIAGSVAFQWFTPPARPGGVTIVISSLVPKEPTT